jgi:hypothetical protein
MTKSKGRVNRAFAHAEHLSRTVLRPGGTSAGAAKEA